MTKTEMHVFYRAINLQTDVKVYILLFFGKVFVRKLLKRVVFNLIITQKLLFWFFLFERFFRLVNLRKSSLT